jgi:hypothetical protein
MNDGEFLRRFALCEIDAFPHRDHVRLAWLSLRAEGWTGASRLVREGLRRFATHHGAARKYHETLTIAWLAVVADAIAESPDESDFDRFVAAHPDLLERDRLARHYSPNVLASEAARETWVAPDLHPFATIEVAR